MEGREAGERRLEQRSRGEQSHPFLWSSSPHLLFLLVMLEKEAWGQPPGSGSGHPHAGADAWGVSLVLGVASLLVSSMLVREEGLEIIGNPSTVTPGGLGADVDERRAFLPAKVGSGAPLVPWLSWPLAVSPRKVPDQILGPSREQQW